MSIKEVSKREGKKSTDSNVSGSRHSRKSLANSSEVSSNRTSADETPERLAKEGYELHELLGEGSYSRVYRATNHKNPGIEYACKRYKINKRTQKWVDRCLTREMNITMLVKHRNIVEAFEAISTCNEAFLVLQYARNGSVRSYIKRLPADEYMEEDKVRVWMSDIFSAVAYLHGKQIAHRDIKTENFLLDDYMKPLLCDFSFACMSPNPNTRFDCMVDTVCGTTAYLAPEVHSLKHGQKYDAKLVDVYALGVSMYEVITKRLPFTGRYKLSDPNLVKRQIKRDYLFPTSPKMPLTNDARRLIDSLLDPNPRTRISINRALNYSFLKPCNTLAQRSTSSNKQPSSPSRVSFRKQSRECSHSFATRALQSTATGNTSGNNSSSSKKEANTSKVKSVLSAPDGSNTQE